MRILLDTNVLLNWLFQGNALHQQASKLVLSCLLDDSVFGYVTSHSLTDIFYILRKEHTIEQRRKFILLIIHNFTVLTEDEKKFNDVLLQPDFFDLEDGLQMKCAEDERLDYIVTENLTDFTNSKCNAIDIESALKLINKSSADLRSK